MLELLGNLGHCYISFFKTFGNHYAIIPFFQTRVKAGCEMRALCFPHFYSVHAAVAATKLCGVSG